MSSSDVSGNGNNNDFANDFFNKLPTFFKIFLILFGCVFVLPIIIGFFRWISKLKEKKEATASSPPPSRISVEESDVARQQQLVSRNLLPNLQEGSAVIIDNELTQTNCLQQELVLTPIYTNLNPDQIIYIKGICNESRRIGEGSFAQVYRGVFHGKDLAIKKIQHRLNNTKKWVENEVELLRGIEHKNINMLYAWCVEATVSYLVYTYISGCNLEDYLRGNCIGFAYSWKQCFKIIIGIAEGIEFLHKNKIIHVDIKPQNIMLEANDYEVKLVDFGFSRKADWEGTHRSTDKIIGTKGYWAPEYCLNHKLSYKHDVFSFGIVVLEMITGERHVDNARSSSQFHIPEYVSHMIRDDRFEEAVDSRLKQNGWDRFSLENALSDANIALRCARPDKDKRPFMDIVVRELTSILMSSNDNISTVGLREEEVAFIRPV